MATVGKGGAPRRKIEEGANDAAGMGRWLLTYADMITLLLGFFIILYSMATINPKKYSDLAQVLETIFAGGRPEIFSANSISAGQGIMDNPGLFPLGKSKAGKREDLFRQTVSVLQPELKARSVRVVLNETGVSIILASDLYFAPGSAKILDENLPSLRKISAMLQNISNNIRIAGYTDERGIAEEPVKKYDGELVFRSNWELSAQRAINVLKYLNSFGVDEKRLSAESFGSTRPIEDNDTPEKRAYNRRVEINVVQID
jgi:chemotaxis protein MotB